MASRTHAVFVGSLLMAACFSDPGPTAMEDPSATASTGDPTGTTSAETNGDTSGESEVDTAGEEESGQPADAAPDCPSGEMGCACDEDQCSEGMGCYAGTCIELPDPMAWWSFEGDLEDLSGNGYHGATEVPPSFVRGVEDETLALNLQPGGARWVDVSALPFEGLVDGATIYARIKLEVAPVNLAAVWAMGAPGEKWGTNIWVFGVGAEASLITETGEGEDSVAKLGPAPTVGEWAEVAIRVDQGQAAYFLDGEFVAQSAFIPTDGPGPNLWIGGNPAAQPVSTHLMIGALDDVRVYDFPLSNAEITALSMLD